MILNPPKINRFIPSDSDLFLNDDELEELTGYKQSKAQARVLRANNIPFFQTGTGRPRVSRSIIQSGGKVIKPAKDKPKWQPAVITG